MIKANFIPSPNSQRIDELWKFGEVSLRPNVQCMGNGFEDMLVAVSMEYSIDSIIPRTTYNYYAIFFSKLSEILNKIPKRHHYFDSSFHCLVLNEIFKNEKIDIISKRKSTHDFNFALDKLTETRRIILLSVNTAVGRHIIRVNSISDNDVYVNDPFGRNPYNTDKTGGFKTYSITEIIQMGINSVIWLETKKKFF